jgi:hypothetical protein
MLSEIISKHAGITKVPSAFALSIGITACTLFGLGAVKAGITEQGVWWKAGVEVTGIGGASATIAFFSAHFIEMLMGNPE